MEKKEIFNKVKEIFKIEFTDYNKEITMNTTFDDIKGYELNKKEFLLQVEEFFEIKIAPRNLVKINMIKDLVEHLYRIV